VSIVLKKNAIGWSYATIVLEMEAIEGRLLRTSVATWNFGLKPTFGQWIKAKLKA
jgi:hypothetical protein